MSDSGDPIHIRSSSAIERPLDPGIVVDGDSAKVAVRLDDPELPLAVGQHVLILRNIEGAFTRQHAWVEAILTADDATGAGSMVGLQTRGDPQSAEQRSARRVRTTDAGRTASLDEEDECPLMDVSIGGFSVVAAGQYAVGTEIDATLRFDGVDYSGRAIVRSFRVLGPNRIRYGLECLTGGGPRNLLADGLRSMTAAIQPRPPRGPAPDPGG